MSQPKDEFIKSALYQLASKNQDWFYVLTLVGLFLSVVYTLTPTFTSGWLNNSIVGLIFGLGFAGVLLVTNIVKRLSKLRHIQAEKFRKKEFIDQVIKPSINKLEDDYLYYFLGDRVLKKAKKLEKENEGDNDNEDDEYFTVLKTEYGRIIESIQQNCNQTARNLIIYYDELERKQLRLWMFFILLGIVGFLLALVKYEDTTKVSSVFVSFISVIFAIDFYGYFKSFKKESNQLEKLANEIDLVKEKVDYNDLLYYFSEYIGILEIKPMTPYRIYFNNKDEITEKWKEKLLKQEKNRRDMSAANKVQNDNAS